MPTRRAMTADYPIPQAYLYRDYVIDAFNDDKPYDQFLREQIRRRPPAAQDAAERWEHDRRHRLPRAGAAASTSNAAADMHLTIDDTIETRARPSWA